MKLEDKHIIQIAKGDIKTFNSFYNKYYPSLCKFSFQFVKSEDTAADIAQETMIEFWLNKQIQSSLNHSKAYLYTIAKNKSLNNLRKIKVDNHYLLQQMVDNEEGVVSVSYLKDEECSLLSRAINLLPQQTQKIIQLTLNNYRNSDITEELDISINTVKTLKKRAYKKLRELLKDHIYA